MPVAARFENADLRNASSGYDTTKIQQFCPNLLHNVANALGHAANHNITLKSHTTSPFTFNVS